MKALPAEIAEHYRDIDAGFAQRVADAQVFEFHGFRDDGEQFPYVTELFASGLIETPYPTVVYRFGPAGARAVLAVDRYTDDAQRYRFTMYGEMRDSHDFQRLCDGSFRFTYKGDVPAIDVGFKLSPFMKHQREIVEANGRSGEDFTDSMKHVLLSSFLHCSLVLSTEGIPRRVEDAPVRLNAKRARTGKPRIPTVTHIDFAAYLRAAAVEPGHHASPVPHLRRGHIRRFEDGRKTWVKPCIVNASEDVKVTKRDAYQVRAPDS